ncbi:MAG: hypothetical protein AAF804_11625, partial [Bacteroidota bacterium]
GKQHRRLVKLISLVDPAAWEKSFGQNPATLVQLLTDYPWGEALFQGWVQASFLYQKSTWSKELLRLTLHADRDPKLRGERGFNQWLPDRLRSLLLSQVPSTDLEPLFSYAFAHLNPAKAIPMPWLLMGELPAEASPQLAIGFAQSVWSVLQRGDSYVQAMLRPWLPSLPRLAYRLPTKVYPQLLGIWAVNPLYSTWYDPFLEQTLQILAFRKRIHQAFEDP